MKAKFDDIDKPLAKVFIKNYVYSILGGFLSLTILFVTHNVSFFAILLIAAASLAVFTGYRTMMCLDGNINKYSGKCFFVNEEKKKKNNFFISETKRLFVLLKNDSEQIIKLYTNGSFRPLKNSTVIIYTPKNVAYEESPNNYVINTYYYAYMEALTEQERR